MQVSIENNLSAAIFQGTQISNMAVPIWGLQWQTPNLRHIDTT
jgi:hypothetical protein